MINSKRLGKDVTDTSIPHLLYSQIPLLPGKAFQERTFGFYGFDDEEYTHGASHTDEQCAAVNREQLVALLNRAVFGIRRVPITTNKASEGHNGKL